jgi:hypothetical protein
MNNREYKFGIWSAKSSEVGIRSVKDDDVEKFF